MRIDLHTHSQCSDGTESPAELMRAVAAAGLDAVALCDHDTVDGWAEAAAALPAGLTLVPGIEISCTADGISLHLLAYLPDPANVALAAELLRVREDRLPRLRRMVEAMSADGVAIHWDELLAHLPVGATVGRPHIADALVRSGVVEHRDQAFAGVLSSDGPYYERHYAIPAERAVRLVRAAGGVPVVAHPAASARGRTVTHDTLRALASIGLAGLEVHHRDNPPEAQAELLTLCAELGLLVTGSSDYHGTGKINRLGENTTDAAVLHAIVEQSTSGVVPVTAGETVDSGG